MYRTRVREKQAKQEVRLRRDKAGRISQRAQPVVTAARYYIVLFTTYPRYIYAMLLDICYLHIT